MAHGNMSDLAFLALLLVVIQWFAFPDTLFQDLGPLKSQFKARNADMDALIKFGGGLLLTFACMLSGVKWNPINGKMAGFGALGTVVYTIYSTYKADSELVPRLFYLYAGAIALGGLHIFAFPSNALPPKSDKVKNNHGNLSDLIALSLLAAAVGCLAYPAHLFQDLGPLNAQFSAQSDDLSAMIKFVACLMLTLALTFSGVKWNPINGKMAGFGGFICAVYTSYSTFKADGDVFVPKLFYVYAAIIFLGCLHIFLFPSNPLPPKAEAKQN